MEELTLNDQIVIYDREATVSAYRSIEQGDADRCQCGGCKNFRQFRNQAYGPKLLSLLERLGSIHSKSGKYIGAAKKPMNVSSMGDGSHL